MWPNKHSNFSFFSAHEVSAVERILYDTGKLRIHVTEKLQRDIIYQVHISFESPLRNESDEEPFYLKKYIDVNSTERLSVKSVYCLGSYLLLDRDFLTANVLCFIDHSLLWT